MRKTTKTPPQKLPPKMYFKNGRYYYVHLRKWHPLERDYYQSLGLYAEKVRQTRPGATCDLEDHINEYLEHVKNTRSQATHKNYKSSAKSFLTVFAEFVSLKEIKPRHLGSWKQKLEKDKHSPSWNLHHSFLSGFFKHGIERGWDDLETNPLEDIQKLPTKKRTRLIADSELLKISEFANPMMQAAILIADQIGQRVSDIRNLRKDCISDQGIYVLQSKTGKQLLIEMTPGLRKAIDIARELCPLEASEYLFHHTTNLKIGSAEAGRPYGYSTWYGYWCDACDKAGVENANFHDIRARVATQADIEGSDAQGLLGHSHKGTTDGYIRDRRVKKVKPLVRNLSESQSIEAATNGQNDHSESDPK